MTETDLIRRWLSGWLLARGLPEPEPVGSDGVVRPVGPGGPVGPVGPEWDGVRSRCDQPGREVEVFALRADEAPESVARLASGVAAERVPAWLTVPTNRSEDVEAMVKAAGLEMLHRSEWLMATDLTQHPRHAPSPPYRLESRTEGAVTAVSLHDASGALAARGTIAVTGTDAVADRIETLPEHRRRGLGSALMSALAEAALARGATTGLLIASADGQHLYSSLGWQHHADVLIARTTEIPRDDRP